MQITMIAFSGSVPTAGYNRVKAAIRRAGGTIERCADTAAHGLDRTAAFERALHHCTPVQRKAFALLADGKLVTRTQLSVECGKQPAKLHFYNFAPFFKSVNAMLSEPSDTLIDHYIAVSKDQIGDVTYQLREPFPSLVWNALCASE